jgi:ribonucleotide reductase alpha subunit
MASRDFATRVALLVQELGGDVNVTEAQRTGGFSSQNTKYYVVGISMHSCNKIFKTITPKRVKVPVSGATRQQVGSYRMTEVTSIEYLPESEMTYCFTESKKGTGIFNGLLTKQCAIAPNASSADLLGVSPSREPLAGNAYNSQGRAGSFLIKNKHLDALLESKGKNSNDVWVSIIKNNGSVSHLDFLTDHEKMVFKAGKEINPMWIIELAAIAQEWICQGQSINIQVPNTITKQEMSDIHILAWKKGLKGLYYCRTEAAEKVDVGTGGDKPLNSVNVKYKIEYQECLSCSG